MNPTLCRVLAYSLPGLPKPTIRKLFSINGLSQRTKRIIQFVVQKNQSPFFSSALFTSAEESLSSDSLALAVRREAATATTRP